MPSPHAFIFVPSIHAFSLAFIFCYLSPCINILASLSMPTLNAFIFMTLSPCLFLCIHIPTTYSMPLSMHSYSWLSLYAPSPCIHILVSLSITPLSAFICLSLSPCPSPCTHILYSVSEPYLPAFKVFCNEIPHIFQRNLTFFPRFVLKGVVKYHSLFIFHLCYNTDIP